MALPYSSYVGRRPAVDVPANWSIALRPALADLQAATAGQFAAGPCTAAIISRITDIVTQLNNLDAAGPIPATELFDYTAKAALIPTLMRQLGLYPNATVAAAAALGPGG